MIELRHLGDGTAQVGYAGDAYNTAVYLRRTADALGIGSDVEVAFLTGLGHDEDSASMRAAWAAEGVLDRSVLVAGRVPGLYAIRVDDHGERRFSYWRDASAARHVLGGLEWVGRLDAQVVHLSGITLQLTTPDVRQALVRRLAELRSDGAIVSFDTNYRPAGWSDAAAAAEAMDDVARTASIVFATYEDEAAMHACSSPEAAARRLAGLGVPEVVMKHGASGAHVLVDGLMTHVPAEVVERVVDTTAAGDAFAGGHLAARIGGRSPVAAAQVGAGVAATVVQHPGAVIAPTVQLVSAHHLTAAR
jgi:2-dehydro-3-deoxygluconokinase